MKFDIFEMSVHGEVYISTNEDKLEPPIHTVVLENNTYGLIKFLKNDYFFLMGEEGPEKMAKNEILKSLEGNPSNKRKMKNICLFGGPSTGKSTVSAGLFYKMKSQGKKVEYIQEYAKDLIYSKDKYKLEDQIYIFAKQHHPWFKLKDQLDYTINDGPFILGLTYLRESEHIPEKQFSEMVLNVWKSYETINIFLERDDTFHSYQDYGRTQNEIEAKKKDKEIKEMLDKNGIPYHSVKVSSHTVDQILKLLEENYE